MKVLTFMQNWPKGHVRAGEPTYFVEKILWSLYNKENALYYLDRTKKEEHEFYSEQNIKHCPSEEQNIEFAPKLHTIRRGNRWNVGDVFRPCVWLGTPRRKGSRLLQFAPPIQVVKTYKIGIDEEENRVMIDHEFYCNHSDRTYYSEDWRRENSIRFERLCINDGITPKDFISHFQGKDFEGQIVCWGEVGY